MAFYEIYFSPTGGTKQTAWIVSSVWDEEKKEIDLSDPKEDFSNIQFLPVDICGGGSVFWRQGGTNSSGAAQKNERSGS